MHRLVFLALFVFAACNGISQSEECKRYLACVDGISAGSSANYASYAENGSCWSTDQRSADQCTVACVQGRNTLKTGAGSSVTECQ